MSYTKEFTLVALLVFLSLSIITQAKSIRGPQITECKERHDFCTKEYNPVCGFKPNIVCKTTPCNYITYSNPCEACRDEDVVSYTEGPCKEEQPVPPITEPTVTKCSADSRNGDVCPAIYAPVCGYKPDIVCITTPCNSITYSNACEACHDSDESYTAGECPSEPVIIVCDPPKEPEPIKCTDESREGPECPPIYDPVCGYKPDIMCINPPCNYATYGSACEACYDKNVESYTPGECTITSPEVEIPIPEPATVKCLDESRGDFACIEIYAPVCGYKPDIVCFKAPCNHITYGNSCEACLDPDVESYTYGECPADAS